MLILCPFCVDPDHWHFIIYHLPYQRKSAIYSIGNNSTPYLGTMLHGGEICELPPEVEQLDLWHPQSLATSALKKSSLPLFCYTL